MNILFLTLSTSFDINDQQSIYSSILYEFIKRNDKVYVVSSMDKKNNKQNYIIEKENFQILKVRTGNIQKTNIIEKGISTILIEYQFKNAIKKHFKNIKFDLILYATPPITFYKVINYFKKRDNAKTYLMLKDIFPQNAVDLKIFSKKSLFYKYFRNKEKNLYNISDKIGCMSPKNKEYLLENNKYLDASKIEIFPNSINPQEKNIRNMELNKKYRKKYNIPLDSKVFMYGGNLGKPQGISFVIECLKKASNIKNSYFVICGTGTEYKKIADYKNNYKPKNLLLINGLPKNEYNELLNIADVGLIFLDYNFTIPNFPSRLLSYMEKGIPILSCTDPNTDVGTIISENEFGWQCKSNDANMFKSIIEKINKLSNEELQKIGNVGLKYLNKYYRSDKNIEMIMNKNYKKRVLILTTVFAPYRVELFNEIAKHKNIDLTVYFEQANDKVRNKSWYNYDTRFKTVTLKNAHKSLKNIKFDFIKVLQKKQNYDLVIFYEPSTITASLAIEYCIFNNIKYMLNCDGAILKDKENILKKFVKTRNIKNACALISNGISAKNYYMHYGANENKIFNHHFSNLKKDEILNKSLSVSEKNNLKKELGLKYDYIFISVGNFIHRKGYDWLLQAIKKFNSETKKIEKCGFIFIGSGIQKEEYIEYINQNNLKNVIIKDFMSKNELLKYYDASNCFCLLTREDIWGLVIHEAMSRGLPVISTNKCNAALELIENEKCGYVIDINQSDETIINETAQKFKKIISQNEENNSQTIIDIAQKYTIEISANEHINIINDNDN